MTGIRQRILQRYLPVGIVLAGMGYLFGEAFLFLQKMYGGAVDPGNDQVRWRTPLTMTAFGLMLMLMLEGVMFAVRRKPPTKQSTELME